MGGLPRTESVKVAERFPRQGLRSAVQHLLRRLSGAAECFGQTPSTRLVAAYGHGSPGTQECLTGMHASSFGALGRLQLQGRKAVWVGAQDFTQQVLSAVSHPSKAAN